MVETGAKPEIPRLHQRFLQVARMLTTPLLPDDYLALINPSWSTRELTGQVVRVRQETPDAATVVVRPSFPWPGHIPGQYLRIGMEINGVRHWRAYTITSDPNHPEGLISITVKHTEGGRMSPVFARKVEPGTRVFLGEVEGTFVLPSPLPEKMLMISAGSGVTPLFAMLRELDRRHAVRDIVHIHSCRHSDDMILGSVLRHLAEREPGYRLCEIHTRQRERWTVAELDTVVPDWRERETFLSGPRDMIDAVEAHYEDAGLTDRLHTERFQPIIGTGGGSDGGSGGTVHFRVTDADAECEPGMSILVGGEQAGASLPFGCRMGICHTCVGRLKDGQVRDLRTGEMTTANGQMIRTCVNAPEGHVEIDL